MACLHRPSETEIELGAVAILRISCTVSAQRLAAVPGIYVSQGFDHALVCVLMSSWESGVGEDMVVRLREVGMMHPCTR